MIFKHMVILMMLMMMIISMFMVMILMMLYDFRDACDDVCGRVPRNAYDPHHDDDAHDDHDDVYGRGHVYDLLYDDYACGLDNDDDPHDDYDDGAPYDRVYVHVYVCDDGLRDAYDPRDVHVYGHVRVCGDDPHDGRDDVLRDGRVCAHVCGDAVPPYVRAYDALCDRVHDGDDVPEFPYDCDDDDAR